MQPTTVKQTSQYAVHDKIRHLFAFENDPGDYRVICLSRAAQADQVPEPEITHMPPSHMRDSLSVDHSIFTGIPCLMKNSIFFRGYTIPLMLYRDSWCCSTDQIAIPLGINPPEQLQPTP